MTELDCFKGTRVVFAVEMLGCGATFVHFILYGEISLAATALQIASK